MTKLSDVTKIDNSTISVLGSTYTLRLLDNEEDFKDREDAVGLCAARNKELIINLKLVDNDAILRETLRHEVFHAFLFESGLDACSSQTESWALNEEMVDWFALQSPKIFQVFKELDVLD